MPNLDATATAETTQEVLNPVATLSIEDLKGIKQVYDYFPQFDQPRTYIVSKTQGARDTQKGNKCIYISMDDDRTLTRVSIKHLVGQMLKNNEPLADSIFVPEKGIELFPNDRLTIVKSEDGAIYFDPASKIR